MFVATGSMVLTGKGRCDVAVFWWVKEVVPAPEWYMRERAALTQRIADFWAARGRKTASMALYFRSMPAIKPPVEYDRLRVADMVGYFRSALDGYEKSIARFEEYCLTIERSWAIEEARAARKAARRELLAPKS